MKDLIGKAASRRCLENPIFVVGAGRSGTSVLVQALGKHPWVLAAKGEAPLMTSIASIVSLCEHDSNREFYLSSLNLPKPELYSHLRRLSFEICCGSHYGLRLWFKTVLENPRPLRKRVWVAKTFPTEHLTRGLQSLYPGMKLLYVIRNGIEVVQSRTQFHGFREKEFEKHCQVWVNSVEKYRYLNDYEHAITIRHDELIEKPGAVIKTLLEFLALPPSDGPLDFLTGSLVHPLNESTRAGTDVRNEFAARRPPYESWSEAQRELFRGVCGDKMSELGYSIPF